MIGVIGSINLDMIATGDRLPLPGETVSANNFITAPGGKGANQALAAARAGAMVKMYGAVGNDDFAALALCELKIADIDLSAVTTIPGPTGIAIILVDGAGENVITIVPGANGGLTPDMALSAIKEMAQGDYVLMQHEIPAPAIRAALLAARSTGITSILNIAPIIPETANLAGLADIIVANETEFAGLSGISADNSRIEKYAARWARDNDKILIITLGDEGVIGATPHNSFHIEALAITPVDTVGAGDTFCGYLGAALEQGMDLKAAIKRAAIAGSLACLKNGAQPAIPFLNDVLNIAST